MFNTLIYLIINLVQFPELYPYIFLFHCMCGSVLLKINTNVAVSMSAMF